MGACSWQLKSGKCFYSVAKASRSCMSHICGIRPGGMTTYVTRVVHTSCAVDIFVTNMGHTSGKSQAVCGYPPSIHSRYSLLLVFAAYIHS